jgi:hypothetical protein
MSAVRLSPDVWPYTTVLGSGSMGLVALNDVASRQGARLLNRHLFGQAFGQGKAGKNWINRTNSWKQRLVTGVNVLHVMEAA